MLLKILRKQTSISLRLLDFLVTNYSKNRPCVYTTRTGVQCNIYDTYKNILKSFTKRDLDPFCRRARIMFTLTDPLTKMPVTVETTCGQLNFFRFAIENDVIQYAEANSERIEAEMNVRKTSSKTNRQSSGKITTASISPATSSASAIASASTSAGTSQSLSSSTASMMSASTTSAASSSLSPDTPLGPIGGGRPKLRRSSKFTLPSATTIELFKSRRVSFK